MYNRFIALTSMKELVTAWTVRTIRGRYQQSILGWLWAVIQPLASVLILTIIFTYFIPLDTGDIPYPVFSYVAVVPWTLFSTSLQDMTNSIVQNMNLVNKIYFPREILPISAMFARLLDLLIAYILLLAMVLVFQLPFYPLGWIFLPVILFLQIILMTGLGLITSALNVFSRDIQPLLTLILQIWFYATPIIYPVSMVPENIRPIYFLNPMAGIIEAYRDVLISGNYPDKYLLISALISIVVFLIGYYFFKRVEFIFSDIL